MCHPSHFGAGFSLFGAWSLGFFGPFSPLVIVCQDFLVSLVVVLVCVFVHTYRCSFNPVRFFLWGSALWANHLSPSFGPFFLFCCSLFFSLSLYSIPIWCSYARTPVLFTRPRPSSRTKSCVSCRFWSRWSILVNCRLFSSCRGALSGLPSNIPRIKSAL